MKHLCSYAGLVSSTHQSGGVVPRTHNQGGKPASPMDNSGVLLGAPQGGNLHNRILPKALLVKGNEEGLCRGGEEAPGNGMGRPV